MRAADATFTVLDFEGTGAVDGHADEPWQIGLVRVRGGRVAGEECRASLLNVGERAFSRHSPGRHEALRADIRRAPRLKDLWPELRAWLVDGPLVGHNVSTEKRFLHEAFPLHRFGPWVDTLKLARMAFPSLPAHRLQDLIEHLSLDSRLAVLVPERTFHDALYDAMASALLLETMLALPGWEGITVSALVSARPVRYHRHRAAVRHARPR